MEVNQVNQQETLPLGWQHSFHLPRFSFLEYVSFHPFGRGGGSRWKVVSDFIDLNPPIGCCSPQYLRRRTYACQTGYQLSIVQVCCWNFSRLFTRSYLFPLKNVSLRLWKKNLIVWCVYKCDSRRSTWGHFHTRPDALSTCRWQFVQKRTFFLCVLIFGKRRP